MLYRKRPVVIDEMQYINANWMEIDELLGGGVVIDFERGRNNA
jgi:hypothetical protein